MVMPLYDDNPFRLPVRPVVTWGLIVGEHPGVPDRGRPAPAIPRMSAITNACSGVTPGALLGEVAGALPPILTFVTYMFLHGDIGHLFGNMIFLWVFGDDIEEALGRARFLVFYLLCGVVGAAVFVWSAPHAQVTLIGASGAISGIVIAYVMLRPCAKVTFLVGFIPLRISACTSSACRAPGGPRLPERGMDQYTRALVGRRPSHVDTQSAPPLGCRAFCRTPREKGR